MPVHQTGYWLLHLAILVETRKLVIQTRGGDIHVILATWEPEAGGQPEQFNKTLFQNIFKKGRGHGVVTQ